MQNTLFEDLKDIKKDIAQKEKRENEEKANKIRREKEEILKDEFLNFIDNSGVKKIDR